MLFEPTTAEARAHLEEHTDGMWFGGSLAIEPPNVDGMVDGLQCDGFTVGNLIFIAVVSEVLGPQDRTRAMSSQQSSSSRHVKNIDEYCETRSVA